MKIVYLSDSQQKGMATLSVTAFLLIGILILTLASYKSIFFQLKRIQNTVLATQLHWRAEGRLECAMAVIRAQPSSSIHYEELDYSFCDSQGDLRVNKYKDPHRYKVTSEEEGYRVTKIVRRHPVAPLGAVATNAHVIFMGKVEILPQAIEVYGQSKGELACLSVNYSDVIEIYQQSQFQTLNPDAGLSQACDFSYRTHIRSFTSSFQLVREKDGLSESGQALASEAWFNQDFNYQENWDPFQAVFGVARTQYSSVKSLFHVIRGGLCDGEQCHCDDSIARNMQQGKRLIWVEGNCDLGQGKAIVSAYREPMILVVENGIMHSQVGLPFEGIFYYFQHDAAPTSADWQQTTMLAPITAMMQHMSTNRFPAFWIQGQQISSGSLIIDAPTHWGVIQAEGGLAFDQQSVDAALSHLFKPQWQAGSWHDF